MPLSDPSPRKHIHTRSITFRGYEREGGLWDIEAHMTDTKTYAFENKWRGAVAVGEPLHEMLVRLSIDDSFVIREVEVATDNSPFQMCPDIAPKYQSLVGVTLGPGWRRAIRERVGGIRGCTHLTELLYPMATVAIQTIMPLLRHRKKQAVSEINDSP
ncbi:MAG: DUF2889 domain-containing protein, partial [Pseudohongiellaceae bacterium]